MLDTTATALTLLNQHQTLTSNTPNYLDFLEDVLDDRFQGATRVPEIIDITPPAGSLNFVYGVGIDFPRVIGVAASLYWQLAIGNAPGMVSTTNDAAKIAAPIEANLRSLGQRYVYSYPAYYEFVEAIYSEVRTIIWQVTDSAGVTHVARVE